MNDFATVTEAAPETPSTVIDTETTTSPSGGGVPKLTEEPSLRDTISAAYKEDEARAKADEPKVDEKPEAKAVDKAVEKPNEEARVEAEKLQPKRAEDGKFTRTEEAANEVQAKPEQQDRDHRSKAPESFLPDSKELWRNVPRPVQRDIDIMQRQHQQQVEQYRTHSERYEAIRDYDELARSNGRDLRQSLEQVKRIEDALEKNPIAALNMVLMEAGPRKADGQPISLFEVAQYVVQQGPQAYQQMMQQASQPQQQQREDPRVSALQTELAQLKEQQVVSTVIEPFAREHPRYNELQGMIAEILKSAMIPANLSPAERLEAAYVYADRLSPASHDPAQEQMDPEPERRAANSFNGTKSVKSSPGSVTEEFEPERGGSIRDVLMDEVRRRKHA